MVRKNMSLTNTILPDIMILAAGRGQRLRPLTDTTPKALLRVGSKTLLGHHLQRMASHGFTSAVINLAWLGEQIRQHLDDDARRFGMAIRYSDEPEGALNTGGGIVHALAQIKSDPFIVLNADVLCDFNYAELAVPDSLDMQLVLAPTPPYRQRGDFALVDRCLQPLPAGAADSPEWTYTGIGCFRRRAFDGFSPERFPLRMVIERAIASGRAGGVVHGGAWLDVGTPQRLALARQRFAC